MKNRFFTVILLAITSLISANDNTGEQLAIAFAHTGTQLYVAHQHEQRCLQTEKNYRRMLYWLSKNNPSFYKRDKFQKDLDFFITILADHIKVMEGKIILKESGLKSAGMSSGVIASTMSTLCAYASYGFLKQRKIALLDPAIMPTYRVTQEYMSGAVGFGLISAICAAAAATQFYNVYRYADRLVERLERDKKILAILQQEKAVLDSKKATSSSEAVLNNLVGKVCQAIDNVLRQPAAPAAMPLPAAIIKPVRE